MLVTELAGRVPGGASAEHEVQRFHALWDAAATEVFPESGADSADQERIGAFDAAGLSGAVVALAEPAQERTPVSVADAAPATLNIRHDAATSRGEAGDAAGAAADFIKLATVRVRVQGAGHPDTLNARRNAAHWRREARKRPAP